MRQIGLIRALVAAVICGIWIVDRAAAVVFYSTSDPDHNTTEPTGSLAGSGWQFQGKWLGYSGTVISPNCFVTVRHIGGQIGNLFQFRGVDYMTTAFYDDPNTDLRIWRVCGVFPAHAQLYERSDEAGKPLVVIGRGTQRGTEVVVNGQLKGWRWGSVDRRQRWGQNTVASVINGDSIFSGLVGGSKIGELLKVTFSAKGGPNEAHLSNGDSGGAVFIHDGTAWKLAGINWSVDGPYNTSSSGAGFQASIFDEGGLYKGGEGRWTFTPDTSEDVPGAFFAIRVRSRLDWIGSVIDAAASAPCTPGPDDFDGDGLSDLLLQDSAGTLGAWFMNGAKMKSASLFNPRSVDPKWRISATADFNRDGWTDVVFQHQDGLLGIWHLRGTTLVSGASTTPSRPNSVDWRVAGSADFNGDSKPDLLLQHSNGTVAAWLMDGNTLSSAALLNPSTPGSAQWRVAGTGDWNRDMEPDLLFQHSDGTLGLWFMDGLVLREATLVNPSRPSNSAWKVAATIDLNQDGFTDLVFQHQLDQTLAVWFMNGSTLADGQLLSPSKPGLGWKIVAPK